MDNQSAPTAADIKEPFSPLQPQLAADVVQFSFLGGIEVLIWSAKIRAGIHHPSIEVKSKEVIGSVVMICYCLSIAIDGMDRPGEFDCLPAG